MDVVLAVVLFFGSFLFAYFIWKKNSRLDQKALGEEIDRDFIEEFALDKSPKEICHLKAWRRSSIGWRMT